MLTLRSEKGYPSFGSSIRSVRGGYNTVMSRAFMKERDDLPEPPVIPKRTGTNYVTPQRLEALRDELAHTTDEQRRAYLQDRIESAVVVPPPEKRDAVAFGATVGVEGAAPAAKQFTIVDEDDADVRQGRISVTSPLAEALLGAHVGDEVRWHRPAGDRVVTVRSISYED